MRLGPSRILGGDVRAHGIAAFASIVLLAASSAGYYRALARAGAPVDADEAIAREKHDFLDGRTEDVRVDPRVRGLLLNPALALPTSHLFPFEEIGALFRYARSCDETELDRIRSPGLAKAKIWHTHVCAKTPLPDGFFEEYPFMHPSGVSFAMLAIDEGPPEAHVRYLHASELALVATRVTLSAEDRILSRATAAELEAFSANAPIVLTADHVFFFERAPGDDNAPSAGGTYRGFPLETWSKVQGEAPFRAVPFVRGTRCLLREGNACWTSRAPRTAIYGSLAAVDRRARALDRFALRGADPRSAAGGRRADVRAHHAGPRAPHAGHRALALARDAPRRIRSPS
jgi:hypothetical protein